MKRDSSETYGIQTKANRGRDFSVDADGKEYYRYPVKTPLIVIDDDLDAIVEEFGKPYCDKDDVFCITSKVISICEGFYVKEEDLKVTWLAKFLVRFITKHPDDPGFAIPQKIQVAMNEVGMVRFLFAVFVGGALKYLGKPGYFYRIAGSSINAIDGFAPEFYPPELQGYGFLAPKDPDGICDKIEQKHGVKTAMLDGNNVESIILGMSKGAKNLYTKEKLLEIIFGNPQGQDDGTPILIVKDSKYQSK